jgi:starvation-inducible DNA-binding protein
MKTRNTLDSNTRRAVAQELNQHVANTLDLYSQVKHAHWNVRGDGFRSNHELFDEIAAKLLEHGDEMAERSIQLGFEVAGTVRSSAKASQIQEYPHLSADGPTHLAAVADRLSVYGSKIRESIDSTEEAGDKATSDMLTAVSQSIDKYLWMVEANLDEGTGQATRLVRKSA